MTLKENSSCLGIIAGVSLFALTVFAIGTFNTIGVGERGVVDTFGQVHDETLPSGFHVVAFWRNVTVYDTKVQLYKAPAEGSSKDLQKVVTEVSINYQVSDDPDKVKMLKSKAQGDYVGTIMEPAALEAVKSITAHYDAAELITKRPKVREAMEVIYQEKLDVLVPGCIQVSAFNITDFSFDEGFLKSIEKKVQAEQEALKAENEVRTAKAEADKEIENARGKAARIKAEAEALRGNPDIIKLRFLEKWDGHLPRVMGGDNDLMLMLNPKVSE